MLVWTAGKSGSSKSSPFFRQLSRSRSNSELITLPSLTELLTSSSPHPISLSGPGSARFGGALWTGCARGSCRGKGGPACLLVLLVQATLDPRTGRGRRILGVTSFSCPASNPKLWKFQAPLQGLRVDTSPHIYDRITPTRVAWLGC